MPGIRKTRVAVPTPLEKMEDALAALARSAAALEIEFDAQIAARLAEEADAANLGDLLPAAAVCESYESVQCRSTVRGAAALHPQL